MSEAKPVPVSLFGFQPLIANDLAVARTIGVEQLLQLRRRESLSFIGVLFLVMASDILRHDVHSGDDETGWPRRGPNRMHDVPQRAVRIAADGVELEADLRVPKDA